MTPPHLPGRLARLGGRARRLLGRRSVVRWVPLLGVVLTLSAVGPRYVFDDYVLGLAARGEPTVAGLPHGEWELFRFTTGERAMNRQLMAQGMLLPWWSDEQLEIGFFRPLSSLLHRLDFALWPDSPRAMYLHGLAWFGLAIALAARLYQNLEASPWLAGLSSLLFAIDDSHGAVVAWISNRNALIATVFGLLALLAHHEWRAHGRRAAVLLAPLAWLLALSAGEFALGALSYIVSYTLFLDPAPLPRRLDALLPYAAVAAVWGAVYASSGAVVRGSESYVSPWLDFARFAAAAPLRGVGLLAATFGPIPAELLLLARSEQLVYWAAASGLVLAFATGALWQVVRRDRLARFWLAGMVLAIVPVTASFPSDRLLLLASVGGMGLLSRVLAPLLVARAWRSLGMRAATLTAAFGAAHLVLAPLCLPLRAAQMQLIGRTLEVATTHLDRAPQLERRTVVILNAPLDALASYIQAERAFRRAPRARHLYWLTTAGSSLQVTRTAPNTLRVERSDGFFSTPLERHYLPRPDALKAGDQVRLGPVVASVLSVTDDARPRAVSFSFAERLESDSYLFLVWRDGVYEPLALDALARPLRLPAEDLGRILAHTALRGP